ncbi:MAG: hypothetical protein KME21_10230 [Desmonostoc vinosum HA7617-LM4]|nr:hypothetical protein [Desmonostoc vinosum HA7617-LM4]
MHKWIVRLIGVAIALTLALLWSTSALSQSKQPELTVGSVVRSQVIESVIEKLGDYVFPDVAQKTQLIYLMTILSISMTCIGEKKTRQESIVNELNNIGRCHLFLVNAT